MQPSKLCLLRDEVNECHQVDFHDMMTFGLRRPRDELALDTQGFSPCMLRLFPLAPS